MLLLPPYLTRALQRNPDGLVCCVIAVAALAALVAGAAAWPTCGVTGVAFFGYVRLRVGAQDAERVAAEQRFEVARLKVEQARLRYEATLTPGRSGLPASHDRG